MLDISQSNDSLSIQSRAVVEQGVVLSYFDSAPGSDQESRQAPCP